MDLTEERRDRSAMAGWPKAFRAESSATPMRVGISQSSTSVPTLPRPRLGARSASTADSCRRSSPRRSTLSSSKAYEPAVLAALVELSGEHPGGDAIREVSLAALEPSPGVRHGRQATSTPGGSPAVCAAGLERFSRRVV